MSGPLRMHSSCLSFQRLFPICVGLLSNDQLLCVSDLVSSKPSTHCYVLGGNFSSAFCLLSASYNFNLAVCGLSSNFFVLFRKLFLDFSRKSSVCVLDIKCLSSMVCFVRSMSLAICQRICGCAIPARRYSLSTGFGFK